MYSDSVQLISRLLPFVALAVGGEFGIQLAQELFDTSSGMAFVSVLVWSYLAYAAHAELLLPDTRDKSEDNKRVLGFALRTFGLGILMMAPVVIAAIFFISQATGGQDVESLSLISLAAIGISGAIAFLIVFSLFGTLLPAYVLDRGRGFGAALPRGISQFFWMTGRMLLGPVFLYAASALVIMTGLIFVAPHAEILGEGNMPNIIAIVFMIIGYLIQAVGTVMVAWILSTAYVRAEAAVE